MQETIVAAAEQAVVGAGGAGRVGWLGRQRGGHNRKAIGKIPRDL